MHTSQVSSLRVIKRLLIKLRTILELTECTKYYIQVHNIDILHTFGAHFLNFRKRGFGISFSKFSGFWNFQSQMMDFPLRNSEK